MMIWLLLLAETLLALQIEGLYLMMGRGLDRLQRVPAGSIVAIGGLGTAILKSATLSSSPAARPLAPMLFQVMLHRIKARCISIGYMRLYKFFYTESF